MWHSTLGLVPHLISPTAGGLISQSQNVGKCTNNVADTTQLNETARTASQRLPVLTPLTPLLSRGWGDLPPTYPPLAGAGAGSGASAKRNTWTMYMSQGKGPTQIDVTWIPLTLRANCGSRPSLTFVKKCGETTGKCGNYWCFCFLAPAGNAVKLRKLWEKVGAAAKRRKVKARGMCGESHWPQSGLQKSLEPARSAGPQVTSAAWGKLGKLAPQAGEYEQIGTNGGAAGATRKKKMKKLQRRRRC
eukprot:gene23899-biopygen11869